MRIAVEGLTKRYGTTHALRDVTLEARDGELLALLGPSGSGKSTLLHAVAGLVAPDAGRVLLDGEDVTHVPPERRGVPVVFQSATLFPHLRVLDNVAFGLRMAGVPRRERERRALEALHDVQLDGFGHRYPSQLSGGEAQRVAIARALAPEPAAILMDEPFSSLDAALRTELQEFLVDLRRRRRVTTLFVTHDQREAMRLGDRTAVLFTGRLHQEGPPRELYERPADARVAAFLGRPNLLAGSARDERVRVPGLGAVPHRTDLKALPDGPVTVVARPEDLTLEPAPDGAGRVVRVVDGGDTVSYRVEQEDLALDVRALGPPRFAPGDRVAVHVTRPLWLLPPDNP